MQIHRIRSLGEYEEYAEDQKLILKAEKDFGTSVVPAERVPFTIPGYSYTAEKQVDFYVDFTHAVSNEPLWRETVNCPETQFNNRMRATFQIFDFEMGLLSKSDLYVTEQVTPIWSWFERRFPNAVGSEYLGEAVAPGGINENGIRNEDMTCLTFDDNSFDAIVSMDVIEHIPDFRKAFREAVRVLKPGGKMLWSVPFAVSSKDNIIRAEVIDGQIKHYLPAEYHGNPLSDEGSLCFTLFGWQMLDDARDAGFSDVYAISMFSNAFGYFGDPHIFFVGIKSRDDGVDAASYLSAA